MRDFSRRGVLGLGLGAAAAVGIAGCGSPGKPEPGTPGPIKNPKSQGTPTPKAIGDGSTADTGPQPNQPDKPVPLQPGETPPQFVVFSWDGAGRSATDSSRASSSSPRTTARA